jgi:hypothetical protein
MQYPRCDKNGYQFFWYVRKPYASPTNFARFCLSVGLGLKQIENRCNGFHEIWLWKILRRIVDRIQLSFILEVFNDDLARKLTSCLRLCH